LFGHRGPLLVAVNIPLRHNNEKRIALINLNYLDLFFYLGFGNRFESSIIFSGFLEESLEVALSDKVQTCLTFQPNATISTISL